MKQVIAPAMKIELNEAGGFHDVIYIVCVDLYIYLWYIGYAYIARSYANWAKILPILPNWDLTSH